MVPKSLFCMYYLPYNHCYRNTNANFQKWAMTLSALPSVGWSVGSVCHNFRIGREVSLPCSYRSTCLNIKISTHFMHVRIILTHMRNRPFLMRICADAKKKSFFPFFFLMLLISKRKVYWKKEERKTTRASQNALAISFFIFIVNKRKSFPCPEFFAISVLIIFGSVTPLVRPLVGRSVCHNFLKGRVVSLSCSYRSTFFNPLLILMMMVWSICLNKKCNVNWILYIILPSKRTIQSWEFKTIRG